VDAVKEEIYRRCDNYVAFAELSSANVDVDLEDLRAELANVMEEFLPQVVSLPHKESAALIEGVERYANGHKHAIARMFETMMEAQEEFEMLAVGITGDFDNYLDDYSSGSDSATDDEAEGSDEESSKGSDGDNDDDDLVSAGEDSEDDQDWEALDKDAVALAEEGEGSSDDEYLSEDSNYTDEYGSSDGFGSDSDDEDDIVSDDYVLEEMRLMVDPMLVDYRTELEDIDLSEELVQRRTDELRRMLVKLGDSVVTAAIEQAVTERKINAINEMEHVMRIGMTTGMFTEAESSREVLESCIEIGVIMKDRLEDLPFSQRACIEDAIEELDDFLEGTISNVQLMFATGDDYLDSAEHLADLDVDGDDDSDLELDAEDMAEIDRRMESIEDEELDGYSDDSGRYVLSSSLALSSSSLPSSWSSLSLPIIALLVP
jgi:hypothetical protein